MIDVNTFIGIYNAKVKGSKDLSDDDKVEIVRSIIHTKKYISYEKKQNLIKEVINEVVYDSDDDIIHYLSAYKYYYFIMMLIDEYTDLSIDDRSFDLLSMSGVIDYVIASFQREYDICANLLEMYMQDLETHRINREGLIIWQRVSTNN